MTQKLPQIYTANHATFPIQIRKITVQICGNFWVTQYCKNHGVRVSGSIGPNITERENGKKREKETKERPKREKERPKREKERPMREKERPKREKERPRREKERQKKKKRDKGRQRETK